MSLTMHDRMGQNILGDNNSAEEWRNINDNEKQKKDVVVDDATGTSTTIESLLLRPQEAELERDHWKDAFARSEDDNAQLKADNEELRRLLKREAEGGEKGRQTQQQQQQQHVSEIEGLQAELARVQQESSAKIEALEAQVTDIQAKEESLIETKQRLVKRINDLMAEGETEKKRRMQRNSWGPPRSTNANNKQNPLPELKEIRDKLDTIELGKEQSDFVAEAVQSRKNVFLPFGKQWEEYGYRIPKPPDEAFDEDRVLTTELLGEDVYVPDPETDDNHDSSNLPWWDEVSLEFEDGQANFIKEVADRKKSIFDRIFSD
jgi:hypothetical protein